MPLQTISVLQEYMAPFCSRFLGAGSGCHLNSRHRACTNKKLEFSKKRAFDKSTSAAVELDLLGSAPEPAAVSGTRLLENFYHLLFLRVVRVSNTCSCCFRRTVRRIRLEGLSQRE